MNENKNNTNLKLKIVLFFVIVIGIGQLVFIFVDLIDYPFNKIDSGAWLQFLGSYLGGAIGGAAAIISIELTITHYKSEYEQTQQQITQEAKRIKRQIIMEMRPYLQIMGKNEKEADQLKNNALIYDYPRYVFKGEIDQQNLYTEKTWDAWVEIKNIGLGPALDIGIYPSKKTGGDQYKVDGYGDKSNCKISFDLAKDEMIMLHIRFMILKSMENDTIVYEHGQIECVLSYKDIYNNNIEQEICITCQKNASANTLLGYDKPIYKNENLNDLLIVM